MEILKIIVGAALLVFGCIFGLDVDNSVDHKDVGVATGAVYLLCAIILVFIGAFIVADGLNEMVNTEIVESVMK